MEMCQTAGPELREDSSAAAMKGKANRKATSKSLMRARRSAKRAAKGSGVRGIRLTEQQHDFIDGFMTAVASALGLTIDPAWREGVRFNLRLVLDHAARVEELPLPDDAEPAPVFHA
jgi:hypothetical protein